MSPEGVQGERKACDDWEGVGRAARASENLKEDKRKTAWFLVKTKGLSSGYDHELEGRDELGAA